MIHKDTRTLSGKLPGVNTDTIGPFIMTAATMSREKMDDYYEFLCSSHQKAAWEKAAKLDGRKLAQWIRHVLDREAIRSGVKMGQHRSELSEESE